MSPSAIKTSAEKSSTTSASVNQAARQPFIARKDSGGFLGRHSSVPAVQMKMTVNTPGDKFEQEADRTANRVMRMPMPAGKLQRREDDKLQRAGMTDNKLQKAPVEEKKLQRDAAAGASSGGATPVVAGNVQSAIQNKTTGGEPLSSDVRGHMEPRFGADFSNVRIHRDAESASLSNQLSARAFTYQNHIFFSRDQYQPGASEGQHLLAHELTHTIQQGHSVQRSPQVSTAAATPAVQRLGVQDALDKFAEWAYAIPGFRLLTLVIGYNPVNMRSADRNAANLLRALIELMPGGSFITQALDNHGVINKAASWIEQQLATLGNIGAGIIAALRSFMDSLSWTDIFDLGGVWERAKRIFTEPIGRLISFATSTATELLKLVKDAILKPLAALAQGTRGYDLLCAILGEDPVTGESVARTAENLLGGFMKLIGQEEIWENIKKGNAIARAWAWFQGALSGLMGMVRAVPGRIVAILTSLTFVDIITIAGAFGKVAKAFLTIAVEFVTWGLTTIWNLLEIIFDVVSPGLMGYIRRTGAALKSILKNPMPFLGNLVRAGKLGFTNFADRIGTHLKAGLIDWLTGSLEGVYIPKALSLPELGRFALSVLGITWAQIRGKIVKALGPNGEKIMQGLELAFDVVKALVVGGVGAAWELIKGKLTDLKDQVTSGIISFVVDSIVKKAIPKILAMFIPGAGFISAIISIYDTVMVFVQKISKIIQVVTAFIDSIVTIAAGNITAAANRVESVLAGLLSLAISFLAGFLGLGKVTDKIMGVVQKVRTTVDKALDAVIGWIVGKAKALFARLFSSKDKPDERTEEQKKKDKLAAIADAEKLVNPEDFDETVVRNQLAPIKSRYKLLTLNLVVDSKQEHSETIHFTASASPEETGSPKQVKLGPLGPVTPVPVNSWIQVGTAFEQVTASASIMARRAGVEVPVQFTTITTDGKGKSQSYRNEGPTGWLRTNFVHGSRHAVPAGGGKFELRPSERGSAFIRPNFYRDTQATRDSIVNQKLPALRNLNNSKEFLSQGDPAREASRGFVKRDPASGRALVPVSEASADHFPPIADHWTNGSGNQVGQATREAWNSRPDTYQIMSYALNLSLGSRGETYTKEIGVDFRGGGE
ncbi:eCIS core domain-containing protein [Rhizobium leguminosarum]